MKIKMKMKKCVGVSVGVGCVGESRERKKRNGMFWNEEERR